MGSSDPLSTRFEIRFGSLNFQATGNGYLMRITNRDEFHPWQSTGPGPIPAMPATDAPAPAQVDAAGTSAPRHQRCIGEHSRQVQMEWRQASRAVARGDAPTDKTTAPTGERVAAGPQFPYGMHNAAATYASSANTNVAAYEDLPGPPAGSPEPHHHHQRRVVPRLAQRAASRNLAWVCRVGLLRRTGPTDVPAVPRHHRLLVRLLRRLLRRKLRPST
jgi:hypothetical protein